MTDLQSRILDFVVRYQWANGGVTPSYQDITDGLGLGGKSHIGRALDCLEAEGRIKRARTRCAQQVRAIEVVGSLSHLTDAEIIAEYDRRHLSARRRIAA